jgi:hypothetical protein
MQAPVDEDDPFDVDMEMARAVDLAESVCSSSNRDLLAR